MARKQVLVQLDDELVTQLDALATQLKVSRSELLRRAAEALLRCEGDAAADRALAEAYRRQPVDPAFVTSVTALAGDVAPRW